MLVQTRGYNAFSYADVSERVGIQTASVHYHFPKKEDLGLALVTRYREGFRLAMEQIDRDGGGRREKLERYVGLYHDSLRDEGRMCLCGMLATEATTLSDEIRGQIEEFFVEHAEWISGVLNQHPSAAPERSRADARALLAGLEGAMLVARATGGVERFEADTRALLDGFL